MLKRTLPVTSLRSQLMAAIIIGLSVFFILAVFQPFGTFGYSMDNKMLFLAGYGVICSVVYIACYAFMMTFLRRWFAPSKWNIIREIITLLPVLFLISMTALLYHHRVIGGYDIRLNDVVYFFRISMAVAIVPFSVLFYRKYLVSSQTTIQPPVSDTGYHITFRSNNKNEKPLTVLSDDLLYVKSEGNYIEIAYMSDGVVKTQLLRNALNQVEGILPGSDFMRIHRSYIVNAGMLGSVILSGSSYSVRMRETDLRLPVSRSMIRAVRDRIGG